MTFLIFTSIHRDKTETRTLVPKQLRQIQTGFRNFHYISVDCLMEIGTS